MPSPQTVSKPALAMMLSALILQGLLFTHLVFARQYGISLRGEGLEILLLITAIVVSVGAVFRVRFQKSPRWLKSLYILNGINFVPLGVTMLLMAFSLYATDPVGTYVAPNGTRITLKNHAGLLGCSVHPYRIDGILEHFIDQGENYIFCFDAIDSTRIEAVRWSPDETQLVLTLNQAGYIEDQIFVLEPVD